MMNNITIISIIILLTGCISTASIEEADKSGTINTLSMSCSKPYPLEQDCSFFSGATRKLVIDGFTVKIGGSSDGKIILIMDTQLYSMPLSEFLLLNSPSHSVAANNSYVAVKKILEKNNIQINRVRALRSLGNIDGYTLELASDGYSALKAYSVK